MGQWAPDAPGHCAYESVTVDLAAALAKKHAVFGGRMVMVGFGCIGQGTLPLLLRHIDMRPEQLTIITGDDRGRAVAASYGVCFLVEPLTADNFERVLRPLLGKGDFLVNLSVEVSSLALIRLCREVGSMYIDTCSEPFPGRYTAPDLTPSQRSNYAIRMEMLTELDRQGPHAPTALITHGANPGIVSHLMKEALLHIAHDQAVAEAASCGRGGVVEPVPVPRTQEEWAKLCLKLGIKLIQVAERDSQESSIPKERDCFVNTWSIPGFVTEACQPAELGWGTHEKVLPVEGRQHPMGNKCAVYLERPGAATRVRSWTPREGPMHAFLITHSESISSADYYTLRDAATGQVLYRPTVHYAYLPCNDTILSLHELAGRNWKLQSKQRILRSDVLPGGMDEFGVLLCGHKRHAYWFGSQLTVDEARQLIPHNNATSLQVTVGVLSGVVYCINHPNLGLIEPEGMDHQSVLDVCRPYLGRMVGVYTDWTPLEDREILFPEPGLDRSDPWQFVNVLVR